VGAYEAKNGLGALLDRVEQGETFVITRHGRPVARLMPYQDPDHRRRVEEAFAGFRAIAAKARLTAADVVAAVREDRSR
jgi:prevent-host-death family protein